MVIVLAALALADGIQAADPPGILNHQGRIAVDGVNFDGSGQFKFALVNAAGDNSYWSNDDSSTTGDEPGTAVMVTVSKGLYGIPLGDVPMGAIPPDVFADNADVHLRVWFSADDGDTFEQLAPDRRFASVGYALSAQSVMGGSISLAGGNLVLPSTTATTGILFSGLDTLLHTFGDRNIFVGVEAGNRLMTGNSNTAIGYRSLYSNLTGYQNTASGDFSLYNNTTGYRNTANGNGALGFNTIGYHNTANGYQALALNTSGRNNTASGYSALRSNQTGVNNAANGSFALNSNATGNDNTANGYAALTSNTTGFDNSACGMHALGANLTGSQNTASGKSSLRYNTTGDHNIALGFEAGRDLTTGDHNIMIGNFGIAAEADTIRIGDSDQTRAFISGIRGASTGVADAISVVIDSNGQLGTMSSSRRYKEDIHSMDEAETSARLRQLRPVIFRYRQSYSDGEKPIQYGLIAEEVAEVFPDLAVYDDEGRPETVKYHLLAPLLLNEVKKQQKDAENREREMAGIKQRLEQLEALVGRLTNEDLPGTK
ncbi:MAG: tail fiber domain-containing protein [Verrucomicrobiales bacterium]|nr:tail fiber domain-containing protein [Verrucomicrobiales bacterium]